MLEHSKRGLVVTFAVFLGAAVFSWTAVAGDSIGRKYTSTERTSLERLKATHEDVARHKTRRVKLTPQAGLNDYRVILHAHAEDASHTGGTLVEMLADAKKMGVDAIMLTDHHRPPRDFIDDRWRGMHDGVLFIPGSESKGFLIYPEKSVMEQMDLPLDEFIDVITESDGLIFLSHVEERVGHSMAGLTGMEIYNRHADAKDDTASLFALIGKMTEPEGVKELEQAIALYPEAMFAFQLDYPQLYLDKWDEETQRQPVVGIAANDCHHNQVFLLKMVDAETVRVGTIVDDDEDMRLLKAKRYPGIRKLTKGRQAGDTLVQLDFDPYWVSFHNSSTHVLAPELTEKAIRKALKAGHAYVSHDWMCDPTGFNFVAKAGEAVVGFMGDEIPFEKGLRLRARFPLPCKVRVIKDGAVVSESVLDESSTGWEHDVSGPGVYRLEAWLTVDTEERIWIYSNPIYIR